jgi:uncharacterized repeat protein (TIGR03803 family)
VHSFSGADGEFPRDGALTQGRDGKLYGTTQSGGSAGDGVLYKQQVGTNGNVVFHNFDGPEGAIIIGGLTLAPEGNMYGAAGTGGAFNQGTLFKIDSAGSLTVLHNFSGGTDGSGPAAAPIEGTDGNFYGITSGSNSVHPTIYQFKPSGNFATIYTYPDFGVLGYPLLQSSNGYLYATAGDGDCGTITKLTVAGVVKSVRNFSCTGSGPKGPDGSLIQASDGFIYGTTVGGGPSNAGSVFRLDGKKGSLTVLYNFGSVQNDGLAPQAGLVEGSDGNFYGTTLAGGSQKSGTIFKIAPDGTYTQLYSFPQVSGVLNQGPQASLVQHTNGSFYGTTENGGTGLGSIFKLDMGLGPFITFVQPHGKIGRTAQILGQGLTGTTSVSFNGTPATSIKVVSDTYMVAVVPSGASTGPVVVTTPSGTLTSNKNFVVK